jgi:hypothetical protein
VRAERAPLTAAPPHHPPRHLSQEPRKVSGLRAVRAHFLYTFQPFDASGFRQLKWPSYWLVLAWSACPLYGAQGLFWLTNFILMV